MQLRGCLRPPSERALKRWYKEGGIDFPSTDSVPAHIHDAVRHIEGLNLIKCTAFSKAARPHFDILRDYCHEMVMRRYRRQYFTETPWTHAEHSTPQSLQLPPAPL